MYSTVLSCQGIRGNNRWGDVDDTWGDYTPPKSKTEGAPQDGVLFVDAIPCVDAASFSRLLWLVFACATTYCRGWPKMHGGRFQPFRLSSDYAKCPKYMCSRKVVEKLLCLQLMIVERNVTNELGLFSLPAQSMVVGCRWHTNANGYCSGVDKGTTCD